MEIFNLLIMGPAFLIGYSFTKQNEIKRLELDETEEIN